MLVKAALRKFVTGCSLLMLLVTAIISCDEDESAPDTSNNSCYTCENFVDGHVIGFDPCRANPAIGKAGGYLIAIPSQGDTAFTYNLPDSLYEFPKEYFAYYQFRYFFPDSARDDFPLKLRYRFAGEEEFEFVICRGDIYMPKILRYVKEQIIIICVTKE